MKIENVKTNVVPSITWNWLKSNNDIVTVDAQFSTAVPAIANEKNVQISEGCTIDKILSADFDYSGYCSVWTDEKTDEWLQTVENGVVTSCSRNGGKKGWQLYSVSRWNANDGKKLKRHLEIEFEERKNRQIYWDDVAMFCYPEEYKLGIYPISKEDIVEIDNLRELATLDSYYRKYLEGR